MTHENKTHIHDVNRVETQENLAHFAKIFVSGVNICSKLLFYAVCWCERFCSSLRLEYLLSTKHFVDVVQAIHALYREKVLQNSCLIFK